jgi:hypothetical protein
MNRSVKALGVVVLAILTMAGACEPDGRLYPDAEDYTQALLVWTDPWLAPSGGIVPGTRIHKGPGANVNAGGSRLSVRGSVQMIRSVEIDAAYRYGWHLVGYSCESGSNDASGFSLSFAKGESSTQATARLSFSLNSETEPDDESSLWQMEIGTSAHHHQLDDWPYLAEVTYTSQCVKDVVPDDLTRYAELDGRRQAAPPYPAVASQPVSIASIDAASDDPFLHDLGINLAYSLPGVYPDLDRYGPPWGSVDLPPGRDMTSLTGQAQDAGYTLSYASCGLGLTIAELRRPLHIVGRDPATLSVRITEEPTVDGPQISVSALIAYPELGGPPTEAAPVTTPCWASPAATPNTFTADGTPWFGPVSIDRTNP